jgi:hypothetical protein
MMTATPMPSPRERLPWFQLLVEASQLAAWLPGAARAARLPPFAA